VVARQIVEHFSLPANAAGQQPSEADGARRDHGAAAAGTQD
jgi:hypothetical protein